jgi:hypothetical protein
MTKKLAEEIQELRQDRSKYQNALGTLERFVVRQLAEEIQEFSQDKRLLAETRVRLITEAKNKLARVKSNFIANGSRLVAETVEKGLRGEITQLKEDIQMARENMFGRKLFEAFSNEFAVTHLNENREICKLRQSIELRERQLAESRQAIEQHQRLMETKNRELRIIKESAQRRETVSDLLSSLNKEKAAVMGQLLENVQTDKLKSAFEKYLPAVLNNASVATPKPSRVITESRSVATGDKSATQNVTDSDPINNVVEIKRLAGLK